MTYRQRRRHQIMRRDRKAEAATRDRYAAKYYRWARRQYARIMRRPPLIHNGKAYR